MDGLMGLLNSAVSAKLRLHLLMGVKRPRKRASVMQMKCYLMLSGLKAGETPFLTALCHGSADFVDIRHGCGGLLVPCSDRKAWCQPLSALSEHPICSRKDYLDEKMHGPVWSTRPQICRVYRYQAYLHGYDVV